MAEEIRLKRHRQDIDYDDLHQYVSYDEQVNADKGKKGKRKIIQLDDEYLKPATSKK